MTGINQKDKQVETNSSAEITLNSDRIYWELLHALEGLEDVAERVLNSDSVFVDEFNLKR